MVDYTKRELNKLLKAYNNIYDVHTGFYTKQINLLSINLKKTLNELGETFETNGYELKANHNSFSLIKIKGNKKEEY